jgi:hypothetical protein
VVLDLASAEEVERGIGIIQGRGEKRDDRGSGLAGERRVGGRDGEILPGSIHAAGGARF